MYTTDAMVLNRRNFGEADEFVSFYTNDFGKLSVKARSSRKVTTKQGIFLHNPAIVRFSFVLARAGYILSGIKSIREYSGISRDITASAYVSSFFALCDSIIYDGQKDGAIWDLFIKALEDANAEAKDGCVSERFWKMEKEWLISLLSILGFSTESLNIERAKNDRELDIYLKRVLENKLERSVEFFGLKSSPYQI